MAANVHAHVWLPLLQLSGWSGPEGEASCLQALPGCELDTSHFHFECGSENHTMIG